MSLASNLRGEDPIIGREDRAACVGRRVAKVKLAEALGLAAQERGHDSAVRRVPDVSGRKRAAESDSQIEIPEIEIYPRLRVPARSP